MGPIVSHGRRVRSGSVLLVFCCLLSLVAQAGGQQALTSAALTGQVEDAMNAAIPGAKITLTQLDRNQSIHASTDQEGRFNFSHLGGGSYEIRVDQPGFSPYVTQFVLNTGAAVDLRVTLHVGTISEKITVTDDAPLIQVARTQVADVVARREIDHLPLNGRNYLDLALLVPSVSRTNTGANQRFAETSAVPGTGISIAGQRNLNNSFIVDGLSANDDAAGLAGTFYSQEVIREFQVITSGGIAEFGRASSGAVSITTESGGNDWRGRVYGFARNQRLDARNAVAIRKDPLTQAQYGVSASGRLRKDRIFLFTNFEQARENRAGFITVAPSAVEEINGILRSVHYGGPPIETGEFPITLDSTNYFARIDNSIAANNQLALRYSFYDVSSINARTVGGLNALSRGSGLENADHTLAVNNVWVLSPRAINEFRAQFTRNRLLAPVNDEIGPAVNVLGVASFGTATFSPVARENDMLQLVDNVSLRHSKHFYKAGVDVLYNRANIEFPGALQGVYTFSSVAALREGRFINFQQVFGEPNQFQSNPNLGIFAQDEWRPRRGLTLNVGLRYELQWLPEPVKTDTNNVAPRFGLAYAPGDQNTVIRLSAGYYYDRIPLRATSNALQRDGIRHKSAVMSFGQAGAPAFPIVLPAFPADLVTAITRIQPDIANGYARQAALQVERRLSSAASVTVGFQHLRGLRIIMSRNVNVPTLSAADAARLGVPNLGRPDLRFGNVSRFESAGDSYYNAMTVSLNTRAASWAGLRVSYTLSKAIDNAGNFFFSSPQNNFDVRDDRGLSDNDQRQRLTVSGAIEAPGNLFGNRFRLLEGFRLSYIFTYASALPFNVLAGSDRNNDTNANDRPVGVGRNTGRGFDFASLDLRLSRGIRIREQVNLELIAESFNTLNRTNLQLPNNVFGPGPIPRTGFGAATAAADSRQIQLGVRVSFR